MKVLMELRPCFDAYAGIPQDTRISYGVLAGAENITLGGHLLDKGMGAVGFRWRNYKDGARQISEMARYIVAMEHHAALTRGAIKSSRLMAAMSANVLLRSGAAFLMNSFFKAYGGLHRFDGEYFADYVWRTLFEKTLATDQKNQVTATAFVGGGLSWPYMSSLMAANLPSATINTSGWDVYISQTPLPGKVSRNTRLIVRYHDSVPIQMPHTINEPRLHNPFFDRSLRLGAKRAFFACNSETTRRGLLRIHPKLKDRSSVVYCCVPNIYFQDVDKDVTSILLKRLNVGAVAAKKFRDIAAFKSFVRNKLSDRYLLAVGTIEPRKNYGTLIAAWDRLRKETGHDIKLVIVGDAGWNVDKTIEQVSHYMLEGDLFWLRSVPLYELRKLYSGAIATVVPSYSEGFSYSGIESMRCRTPVVASGIDVHKEVYGDWARYFDPYSTIDLLRQLKQMTHETPEDTSPDIESAYQHSRRFSEEAHLAQWQQCLGDVMQ